MYRTDALPAFSQRAAPPTRPQRKPQLLLCEPGHYAVDYAINPWMLGNQRAVDVPLAQAQWRALRDTLAERADVQVMEATPGLPDLVFVANAGVLHEGVFVPSRFRHAERRGEEPHYAAWFEAHGYALRQLPDNVICEGAGDVLIPPGAPHGYAGFGQRTDRAAVDALKRLLDVELMPLALVDPRYYHLDTCFCPLPGGGAMYHAAAFAPAALRVIEASVPRDSRIVVSDAEASAFACNAVVLGREIVMHAASPTLVAKLAAHGYEAVPVALGEFLRAGGSARCLTFRL